MEWLTVVCSVASIVLAVLAIWLSLYHKGESDRVNEAVRGLLVEVKTDAKSIATVVMPELAKYGDAVRSTFLNQKTRDPLGQATTTSEPILRLSREDPAEPSATPVPETDDALRQFHAVVRTIDEGSGFSNKQRDHAMSLARRIHAERLFSPASEQFVSSLEKLIDSFASANLTLWVDALVDLFSGVVQENEGIVHTLATMNGMRILEVPKPSARAMERFEECEKLARKQGIEEVPITFRLAYSHRIGDSRKVLGLINEIKSWDPARVHEVVNDVEKRTDPGNIARKSTPQIELVAEAYRELWSKYGDDLRRLEKR